MDLSKARDSRTASFLKFKNRKTSLLNPVKVWSTIQMIQKHGRITVPMILICHILVMFTLGYPMHHHQVRFIRVVGNVNWYFSWRFSIQRTKTSDELGRCSNRGHSTVTVCSNMCRTLYSKFRRLSLLKYFYSVIWTQFKWTTSSCNMVSWWRFFRGIWRFDFIRWKAYCWRQRWPW